MKRRTHWGSGLLAAAVLISIASVSTALGSDGVAFKTDLAGTAELPPTDPDSNGTAEVAIDAATGEVCFEVDVKAVGTPNRGHIHVGTATQNGGIVVPLFELVGRPTDPRNDALERGELKACVSADPAVLEQILANPAGYYVNLHNARFPGGAMRGQLSD